MMSKVLRVTMGRMVDSKPHVLKDRRPKKNMMSGKYWPKVTCMKAEEEAG